MLLYVQRTKIEQGVRRMSSENNMKKIEEIGKLIGRLHQLNNDDWLYVRGTVNALIFAQANQKMYKRK